MKVLIDTNVILDVLMKREDHFEASASLLKLCGTRITGYISASQTTDIFYLLRRAGQDADAVKSVLKKLLSHIKVLDVTAHDVANALASTMNDYEDALLACQAKRQKADYIASRNAKDYAQSPVSAISPQELIALLYRT